MSSITVSPVKIQVTDLRLAYGAKEVIHGISFDVFKNEIFGIIGPAQSGKTSLLKCINRTIELTAGAKMQGTIRVDSHNIHDMSNVYELRRKVGMVAPLPVGLPLSIFDNVAFAPRAAGMRDKHELGALVERCLQQAALWDEVKDRLDSLGTKLSGGQQQRLTIARALSHQPEILCLDEFSIAIDPVTTMRIEDVLKELKQEMTIILVTNLVQQARRLAGRTMFLLNGDIVEIGDSDVLFSDRARSRKTHDYVHGIYG
jgi:phosphate transport system ATP-binding protein